MGEICEGGGFSKRSPSLALPPEERLAFGAVRFFLLGSACEVSVRSDKLGSGHGG